MTTDGTTAWLIEAPGPCYLALGRWASWTNDVNKALRLATQEQAQQVMAYVERNDRHLFVWPGPRASRVTEHMWADLRPASPAQQPPEGAK